MLSAGAMRTLFDAVDHLQDAMTFHRERHAVLAGNVANIDTPGYTPIDLQRSEPLAGSAGAMARTAEGHLAAAASGSHGNTSTFEDPSAEGPDGNKVSLERELAKIDANRVRYTTSSELVSRRLALLRYGASDGNG